MRIWKTIAQVTFLGLVLIVMSCGDDDNQGGLDAGDASVVNDGAISDGSGDTGIDPRRDAMVTPDAWQLPEATIFVDQNLTEEECTDYDETSRSCGAGTARAFKTIAGAAALAAAGDVVLIREGTFNEQLKPTQSGSETDPLVFAAYPDERVVLSGDLRPAVDLSGLSHVIIQGLVMDRTRRWVYLDDAHYCVLRGNEFLGATDEGAGSKSGIWLRTATFNRIEGNILRDNPEDSMALVDSDRNIIVDNRMENAGHALWAVRCGDYNVIRGNYFANDLEKIGEIYDCDGQSGVYDYDATKRNLVERNEFAYVPSSGDHSPYSGIQYAGQDGIIRNNLLHSTVGPGLSCALYGEEARHNTGNRVYNNVFYATDFAGVNLAEGDTFADNRFTNNIFAASTFVANDTRWDWWVDTLDGKPVQFKTSRLDEFFLDHNCFYFDQGTIGSPWLLVYGWRSPGWDEQHPISWWEQNHPELIQGSVETDPEFVAPQSGDFHLSQDSALVDAGAFLTAVTQTGSGSVLPVEDAAWFYDGFGIPGEVGDTIRLEGTETRAVVVSVDLEAASLTLDRAVDYSSGQGVALDYAGTAPDIGAYETDPSR